MKCVSATRAKCRYKYIIDIVCFLKSGPQEEQHCWGSWKSVLVFCCHNDWGEGTLLVFTEQKPELADFPRVMTVPASNGTTPHITFVS